MIDIEEIKYFIDAHFIPGIGWELIEDVVIDHRKLSKEESILVLYLLYHFQKGHAI
ncbi:hypothetical protein [Lysinibacillus sp. Ag94]|uniref:hypothetical protein n=1 Tax=Lysinibacillus sp. Ag94 TaxID=2936682 RepID=UPI00200BF0AE|nr:hypothetical protein [Lysinibacillus sp. Ag94]UPW85120.1 hypothetical protein MY533_09830 [Lysinibacillus sp. Ag94]